MKQTKQIFVLILGFILLLNTIGITTAVADDEISSFFKKGQPFDVKRECFYNGAPCNVTIYMCYLTTYYPNQSILLNGSVMSGQTNFYNKTFYGTQYPLGNYRNSMHCSDGTNSGAEVFYFQINQSGDNRNNTLFIILALSSVILLIFALAFENGYLGFISGALFITSGIYVMIYGIVPLADDYTRAIAYVSLGLGLLFSIIAGYKIAEDTNLSESAGGIDFKDGFE